MRASIYLFDYITLHSTAATSSARPTFSLDAYGDQDRAHFPTQKGAPGQPDGRRASRGAASQAILSYDYRTFEAGVASARSFVTRAFVNNYGTTTVSPQATAVQAHTVVRPTRGGGTVRPARRSQERRSRPMAAILAVVTDNLAGPQRDGPTARAWIWWTVATILAMAIAGVVTVYLTLPS